MNTTNEQQFLNRTVTTSQAIVEAIGFFALMAVIITACCL